MINIAAVDDNVQYIKQVEILLNQNIESDRFYFTGYTNEKVFINELKQGKRFDIVYLDIILNSSNGIDIAQSINKLHEKTKIIFISADSKFFKDVYDAEHTYFLVKPFESVRFTKALNRAVGSVNKGFIFPSSKIGKINIDNILFFESILRKTKVYYSDGSTEELSIKLAELEALLPQRIFLRTHKSFIINIEKHISSERFKIYMPHNYIIPVSKRHVNEVRNKITLYLGGLL